MNLTSARMVRWCGMTGDDGTAHGFALKSRSTSEVGRKCFMPVSPYSALHKAQVMSLYRPSVAHFSFKMKRKYTKYGQRGDRTQDLRVISTTL